MTVSKQQNNLVFRKYLVFRIYLEGLQNYLVLTFTVMGWCVAHKTWFRSSKIKVTLMGQLKIPVRSVNSTHIEVHEYNFAQMFFVVWQCVAYNTWVRNSKVKVTLKGQLKTIVLCICLVLFRLYFAHSVKDYKIIW